MAEWLKAHDSKSCGRVDRLGSSNLPASAIFYCDRIDIGKSGAA